MVLFATAPLFHELDEHYAGEPEIIAHLDDVKADVLSNLDDFREGEESPFPFGPGRVTAT